ncbi:exodeoxyribonuclease V subunit gamma [Pedobacter sp. SAFR-022]|uniref:exodeoxyribonuclease V subunit gamma n=1 Tax=Pedobacter sp. SAFR-022 TaxID=3436861 RepID=UPI003F801684
MALHLKVSNSLLDLTKQLCVDLKDQPASVFQPNYLITQTEGMNSWLKLQLASQLGIAANFRFLKPNELIQQVYRVLEGKFQQSLSPQNQCWLLYTILADEAFRERYKTVASYYSLDAADKDLKRLALAEKLSDLFDQYQMYRPEMIRSWNAGTKVGMEHEDWQQYLWMEARKRADGSLPDKTAIADYISTALSDPRKRGLLQEQMPLVQLAGMSVLTAFHLDIFHKIAEHIDLAFYMLNPAPEVYWFEDKHEKQVAILKKKGLFEPNEQSLGNALLTSWGKVIQNTFGLLFENDTLVNAYEPIALMEPREDSLLHKIQADLFNNRPDAEREALCLEDVEDGSLVISSCFTPVREVEALYNYLVHLIDNRQGNLSARDIVVMVTDMDTYAPYIKAIFNNAPHRFPYSLADENYSASDSIAAALLAVLSINAENFKAEQVMQLLDSGYLRKRFRFSNLPLIRKVVAAANFRFGIEGAAADDTIFVSWRYAMNRIMYGICMSGDEEYFLENDGLFPLDMLEGDDALEIIRFCHFMEVLIDTIEERNRPRTITGWVGHVENVLLNLVFDATEEEDEDYAVLMKQLEEYNILNTIISEPISYALFNYSIQQSISGMVKSGAFGGYGITFCSLIPMRSIPFRVVALLGMNFDKFPRKASQLMFNLIDKEKRKGDRNVKENDKHLFLETLLSAGDYLYISYLGQSVKDNTAIPPSALVDELIDYIQTALPGIKAGEKLITKHPLHGFSRKYQAEDSKLFTYLIESDRPLERAVVRKTDQFEFSEVQLDIMLNFLKNPIKGYYNKALSIYYNEEEVLLSDTELFDLDHLQTWGLKNQLLECYPEDIPQLRNKLVKTGGLPLKNMANVVLEDVNETVDPVRARFRALIGDVEERFIPVNLQIAVPIGGELQKELVEVTLVGTLNRVYKEKMVVLSWSSKETKYLLEAYIKYVAARACGYELDLYFISAANDKLYRSGTIDPLKAKKKLVELLTLYMAGHRMALTFHTDFNIKPAEIDTLTFDDFRSKVGKVADPHGYDCSDRYLLNKYNEGHFDLEMTLDRYKECARLLLLPLEELFADYYANPE